MKIKTVTCHDVYNYGASLQAYALQSFLQAKGHDVEIIDYLPDYKKRRYQIWTFSDTAGLLYDISQKIPFLKPLLALWRNRKEVRFLRRAKRFDEFKKDYLKCTPHVYRNQCDFNMFPLDADLFIAGSDQIWNSLYENGIDPIYYCGFAKSNQRCISYAASFGANHIREGYEKFVHDHLVKFDSISVRERSGVNIVENLGLKAANVLDPVFLLEREDWDNLCKIKRSEKHYLLVYDFLLNDNNLQNIAKCIAKEKGLKIYYISDGKNCAYADKNIRNAGPIEFLEWIKHADFVISNSFHASAFSVIFEKQFLVFPLIGHNNSSRMQDFLANLKLDKRFATYDGSVIDYNVVTPILSKLKLESKVYLANMLR